MTTSGLNDHRFLRDVDNSGAEKFRGVDNLRAVGVIGGYFDHEQGAGNHLVLSQAHHLQHGHQLVQLLSDLLDLFLISVHHNGDAVDTGSFRCRRGDGHHGERTTSEHGGDTGNDAVNVFNEDTQGVAGDVGGGHQLLSSLVTLWEAAVALASTTSSMWAGLSAAESSSNSGRRPSAY